MGRNMGEMGLRPQVKYIRSFSYLCTAFFKTIQKD